MTPPATAELQSWAEAFDAWATPMVDAWNAAYPQNKPFSLDTFDGCTFLPDVCLECCLEHDLRYAHDADRAEADLIFRRCVIAKRGPEDVAIGRWFWWWLGWTVWAAVRVGGAGGVFRAAKRLWRKGTIFESPRASD